MEWTEARRRLIGRRDQWRLLRQGSTDSDAAAIDVALAHVNRLEGERAEAIREGALAAATLLYEQSEDIDAEAMQEGQRQQCGYAEAFVWCDRVARVIAAAMESAFEAK